MRDVTEALKLLAPWAGFASLLLGAVWLVFKFLIMDFFKSQKRIKEMEAKEVLSAVATLDAALKDTKTELREHRKDLKAIGVTFVDSQGQLVKFQFRIDELIKLTTSLTGVVIEKDKQTGERIERLERINEEAELVKIGPNSFMIRGKRPPSKP